MASIGQILREARERKQLTTSKAAADTNIKIQHIEAMEREDFSRMAAPIYAKGFIRIYAEYLGLDPAPLIAEYMEKFAPRERLPLIVPEFEARQAGPLEPERPGRTFKVDWTVVRRKAWDGAKRAGPWAVGAVLVMLLVWGGMLWMRQVRTRAVEQAAAEPAVPAARMERQRMEWPLIAEPPEPYIDSNLDLSKERLP